jgi:transcriptional regulator with XRE-family HTH domain
MEIGKKIRSLRKKRGMTLAQLADKSTVALATLSRIENNKMTGTLESHINIARALGVSLSELLSNVGIQEKSIDILPEKEHSDVFVHSDKSSYEMLTTKVLDKKMMPVLLKIYPGGKTHPEEAKPGTEKFLFILEGSLEIHVADKKYTIDSGDTLYFEASTTHYYKNIGKGLARALCVITPPAL